VQYRAVGDLLSEGVLEDILHFRKRRLFVEKLLTLERSKEAV
jgi:hypothetical protein